MTDLSSMSAGWRRVCVTLAVFALLLKVAIPTGFMVEARADAAPAIVLCTAQGAVTIEAPALHHAPDAPAPTMHDAPCAFAAQGAAFVAAEPLTVAAVEFAAYTPFAPASAAQAAPGRGLSAPPLPARGPPQAA